MTAADVIHSASQFDSLLSGVAIKWCKQLRDIRLPDKLPTERLRSLVLSPPADTKKLISIQPIVDAISSQLDADDDPALDQQIRQRIDKVVVDVAGNSGAATQQLSELAFLCAVNRTLVLPQDRFHVSPVGVLAAASFVNAQLVNEWMRQNPGRTVKEDLVAKIAQPLSLALNSDSVFTTGDLWLLDLFARTTRLSYQHLRKLTRSHPTGWPSEETFVKEIVTRFTSASLLYKLIQPEDLGASLAKRSKYSLWPGVETLVCSPAARSLRNLVVGELAHQVVHDDRGLSRGAFTRFLQALLKFDRPDLQIRVTQFVASLFWEILEQEETMLTKLIEDKRHASTVQLAIERIEQFRGRQLEGALDIERRKLDDICDCLQAYDQYNALAALQSQLMLSRRSPDATVATART